MKSWNTAVTRERQASRSKVAQIDAVDLDGAVLRVVQPAQQFRERGLAGAVLADDGERRAGGNRQIEAVEHRLAARPDRRTSRCGSGSRAPAGSARRVVPGASAPAGPIACLQTQHRGGRRGGAVERPRQSAERDHAGAHRGARERHRLAEIEAPGIHAERDRPEHRDVRGSTSSRLHTTGRSRSRVASQRRSNSRRRCVRESLDGPVGKSEQAQFLRRRRIDRESIRVVGMALRLAHLVGVAIAPDRAFAQQPMRGEPGAGQQQRRPPRVRRRAPAPTRVRRSSPPDRRR